MFDIGASELLVVVIVAVLVIGPKDMPKALRAAGRWIGKIRRVSAHFRTGVDAMIREAELEEMEQKWKAQNDAIMAKSGGGEGGTVPVETPQMAGPPADANEFAASAESRLASADPDPDPQVSDLLQPGSATKESANEQEPELPLDKSTSQASTN